MVKFGVTGTEYEMGFKIGENLLDNRIEMEYTKKRFTPSKSCKKLE